MPAACALPLCLVLLASLAGQARAQILLGRVTEEPSRTPVSSVLVELLALDSTRVDRALSDADGRYVLEAPEEGDYLVRLRRLGYRTSILGPVAVGSGTTRLDRSLPTQPVELDALVATGRSRCTDDRGEARRTELLWEHIVKALEVTRVVQEDALLELEMLRFVRELDRDRSLLWREGQGRLRSSGPFRGVDPALLETGGFIQPEQDGTLVYHVPEPNVLLSETFLAGHCFHVVEAEDDQGTLGLAFEPRGDRPDLPESGRFAHEGFRDLVEDEGADVSGVLWLDRESGALETLVYRYVGFRDDDLEKRAGGYARFERLVSGLWVIRQWWVRMPILSSGTYSLADSPYLRVGGIREDGGYLIDAAREDGTPEMPRAGVTVEGRLLRGDLALPFDEAVIRLSGSVLTTRPDADGRFVFPDVPPGRYLATWHAPALDTMGVDPPVLPVEVGRRPPPPIELRGYDRHEVLDIVCPDMDEDDAEGVLLVAVSAAGERRSDEPPQVTLRAPLVPDWEATATAFGGAVRFCEVPAGIELELSVEGASEPARLRVDPHGFRRIDVTADEGR